MNRLLSALTSTIGKKVIVALTGLALVGFTIVHLSGNLLLFLGPEYFNAYAEKLHKNPLLPVAEIGLALMFIVHIGFTLSLAYENRKARGVQKYAVSGTKQGGIRSFASRQMVVTGLLVLFFLVTHLLQFRFEVIHTAGVAETEYEKAVRLLQMPFTAVVYFIGTLLLGGHLVHGIQSIFRSIGFHHPTYTPMLEKAGMTLGILLSLGFASIPVWASLILQ